MATKKVSEKLSAVKKSAKSTTKKACDAEGKVTEATEGAVKIRFSKVKNASEQLWFAGLGVVGQSLDLLEPRYKKATKKVKFKAAKTQAFFDDLIDRGEVVQDKVDARVVSAKEQVSMAFDIPRHLQKLSDKLEAASNRFEKTV